jgi:hypothetical protein
MTKMAGALDGDDLRDSSRSIEELPPRDHPFALLLVVE